MNDRTVTLTEQQLEQLAGKLDAFGETLEPGERDALLAVLTLAAERLADDGDEVAGFQMQPGHFSVSVPPALTFSMLGDPLRMNIDVRTGAMKTGSQ